MASWFRKVASLSKSPWLDLAGGVFLVGGAIFELGELALEDLFGFEIGTGHGIVAFGLIQVLKAIPDISEGVAKITKFEEEEHAEAEEKAHSAPVITRPSQIPGR